MTTTAIEALSFASLTTLLSNPPQYPRNPTHEVREPLVLYIVKVPGSKDVVLTPLKPPTKASISLDAIQSSLYYLHVETPDDEVVRQSLELERSKSKENTPLATPIQRKPLPPTSFANYPPSRRPPSPPKSYPHYQPSSSNGDTQYERFAGRGNNVRLTSEHNSRPLGARPMPVQQDNDGLTGQASGAEADKRLPLAVTIPNYSDPMPQLQDYGMQEQLSSTSPGGSAGFINVTLIRRDPTSGAQWNVASIRISLRKSSLAPLQPIDVVLTSPGYTRFAGSPDSSSSRNRSSEIGDSPQRSPAVSTFNRQVAFRTLASEQRMSLQDVRTRSNDFAAAPRGGANNKRPRQVYSFSSPWQGTCIFSNGVDGKSLKIRHSLASQRPTEAEPGNGVAELRFNLPWSALRLKDANRLSAAEPEKLPISQLIGPTKKERWRRSMQHFRNDSKLLLRELREGKTMTTEEDPPQPVPSYAGTTGTSNEQTQDEYRLSLRLGREKAGGGFKGDSAKLGKLILEDEGLKMGDLVVACCMGVFWQHHEG